MNKLSLHILRLSLGITFFWIGIMILKDPVSWTGFIKPWVRNLIPIPPEKIMFNTAILDIVIGIFLILNIHSLATWLAALFGSLHLVAVLLATGIDEVTVRDIGLLGGTISLLITLLPEKFKK